MVKENGMYGKKLESDEIHMDKLGTTRNEQQLHVYMNMVSLSVIVQSSVRLYQY
jgi:hypothetical protein